VGRGEERRGEERTQKEKGRERERGEALGKSRARISPHYTHKCRQLRKINPPETMA
jgi:hypothetical protein